MDLSGRENSLTFVLRVILSTTCVLAGAACTGESLSATLVPTGSAGPSSEGPSAGPVTDIESFVSALEAAGYQVRVGPVVVPPAFGGFERRAERISIDRILVWAFEYPSVAAARRMKSRISDDGQRIGDATFVWDPHIYGSGRLIVLYMGNRPTPAHHALESLLGRQFAGV